MAQYKLKPVTVKALTVQKILDDENAIPKTHSAHIASLIAGGFIVFQPNSTIVVKTAKGKEIGIASNTLVEDMLGSLSLMPTSAFNALYQST